MSTVCRRNIFEFCQNRLKTRSVNRLNVLFGLNWVLSQQPLWTRRPRLKAAAAVRADVEENLLYTLAAKRAFKRADHRLVALIWQLTAAVFANRSDLEHISYFVFLAGVSRPPW